MILVLDASVIIAFYSEMHEPQLLHEFINYDFQLFVPIAVIEEIREGKKPTWLLLRKALDDKMVRPLTDFSFSEVSIFKKRYPNLDDGEIQVLIHGIKLEKQKLAYLCVFDEGPARKIAKRHNVAKTGTLGLLDKLQDLGIINKERKENLLKQLEHSTFRIKHSNLSANR